MKVKELMSQPVHTCHPDQTAHDAAQLMWAHDCGIVPVVDHEGVLAGVITDRDICMSAMFVNKPLAEIRIAEVMADTISTCTPNDTVVDAEHLMSVRQVHRLPVIDDRGAPIGILSLSDIARRVRNGNAKRSTANDLAETLAAICEPHGMGPES